MKTLLNGLLWFFLIFVLVPFVIAYTTITLGRIRRRRAGGPRTPLWPVVLLGIAAVFFLSVGVQTLANPIAYFAGAGEQVEVTVTGSTEPRRVGDRRYGGEVRGYYLAGETRREVDFEWSSVAKVPQRGDRIPVTIGPLWPYPMFEDSYAAGLVALLGAVGTGIGAFLTLAAMRKRKTDAEESSERDVIDQ